MNFRGNALSTEVHFWTATVEESEGGLDDRAAALPADERAMAERIRAPRRRHQFVLGRVMLRALLRHYLDDTVAARPFRYLSEGKPVLEGENAPLHFSLAHSGGLLVAALSAESPVGVDVEQLRPMPHLAAIADGYFTAAERAWLSATDESAREEAFLRLWTCREALTKVEGQGISAAWHRFELAPGGDAVRVSEVRAADPAGPPRWSVLQPRVAAGYVAAVALPGAARAVQTFEFDMEQAVR
jgi:4'-phosphopantetheinyl transferase